LAILKRKGWLVERRSTVNKKGKYKEQKEEAVYNKQKESSDKANAHKQSI